MQIISSEEGFKRLEQQLGLLAVALGDIPDGECFFRLNFHSLS